MPGRLWAAPGVLPASPHGATRAEGRRTRGPDRGGRRERRRTPRRLRCVGTSQPASTRCEGPGPRRANEGAGRGPVPLAGRKAAPPSPEGRGHAEQPSSGGWRTAGTGPPWTQGDPEREYARPLPIAPSTRFGAPAVLLLRLFRSGAVLRPDPDANSEEDRPRRPGGLRSRLRAAGDGGDRLAGAFPAARRPRRARAPARPRRAMSAGGRSWERCGPGARPRRGTARRAPTAARCPSAGIKSGAPAQHDPEFLRNFRSPASSACPSNQGATRSPLTPTSQ